MILKTSRFFAYCGGLILLLSAGAVTLDVFCRLFFNTAPFHSFELTEYGFALAVAFGYSYTLLSRAHIRIDILYRKFSLSTRTVLDLATLAALTAVAVFLTAYAIEVAVRSRDLSAVSNTTLQMPLVIPQSIWAAGLGWFAFVCIVLLVRCLWLSAMRRNEDVARRIGAGDEPH